MNREIRDQWTAALRSGEYRQGTGVLHRKGQDFDTFCCLGVLCDVAAKAGVIEATLHEYDGLSEPVYYYDRHEAFLPKKVMEWAGITENSPHAVTEDHTLVYLNDERALSFSEIADVIEANF